MSRHIIRPLLTSLLVGLSACARAGPAAPSSVPPATAAPTLPATRTSIPSPAAAQLPTTEADPAGPCVVVAAAETTVYQRPSLDAGVFGILAAGDRIVATAVTHDGWIGFDPGTAQAANVGIFRLRWVQRSNGVSLEGACADLSIVVGPPPGVCFTMAMEEIPIQSEPSAASTRIATMKSGDYAAVVGRGGDWFQVDLGLGSLGLNQTGWMSSESINFNGLCKSLPLVLTPTGSTGSYTDPFAYCAAVGTMDAPDERYAGPAAPEAVIEGLRAKAGIAEDAPDDWVAPGTVWRCMDGDVWACFVGANLPCSAKADTSTTPRPEMEDFCSENPDADFIPAAVTGRATVYEWRCDGATPEVVQQLVTPDAQGFPSDIWFELTSP